MCKGDDMGSLHQTILGNVGLIEEVPNHAAYFLNLFLIPDFFRPSTWEVSCLARGFTALLRRVSPFSTGGCWEIVWLLVS